MATEWLPLDEAAERLGMSRSALHRAVLKGHVKATRRGRRLLVAGGDEGGMHPIPSRDVSRDSGHLGAPRKPTDGMNARLAAQRAALLEVETERARLALYDERAAQLAERRQRARQEARERGLQFAKLLLPHAPVALSTETLNRFATELELLTEETQPESVTAALVARLLVNAARNEPQPEEATQLQPADLDPMVLFFMASRLGLL